MIRRIIHELDTMHHSRRQKLDKILEQALYVLKGVTISILIITIFAVLTGVFGG